jgi:hypothetical protein
VTKDTGGRAPPPAIYETRVLPSEQGVLHAGTAHYNTPEDVDRPIAAPERIL